MDNDLMMRRTCPECPWLRSSEPGKFPPERYVSLAKTCKPGGMPSTIFACHMSPDGKERACAGMLVACRGDLPNRIRLLAIKGRIDPQAAKASGALYESYRALAEANGCDPDDPEFAGLP